MHRSQKTFLQPVLAIGVFFGVVAACNTGIWSVLPSGLRYKLLATHSDYSLARPASTVKLRFEQRLGDSVTLTSEGNMPLYQQIIPGSIAPYSFTEPLFFGLREGDTILVAQRIDSMLRKGLLRRAPTGARLSDVYLTTLSVIKVFPFDLLHPAIRDSLVREDRLAERKKLDSAQAVLGHSRLGKWLASRHISAESAPAGGWMVLTSPGEGETIDSGSYLTVRYRLTTCSGKLISGNLDTSGHQLPLVYKWGSGKMMPAVDRALIGLQKGAIATLYLPVMVGPGGLRIGTNSLSYEDYVLEIKILSVSKGNPTGTFPTHGTRARK